MSHREKDWRERSYETLDRSAQAAQSVIDTGSRYASQAREQARNYSEKAKRAPVHYANRAMEEVENRVMYDDDLSTDFKKGVFEKMYDFLNDFFDFEDEKYPPSHQ